MLDRRTYEFLMKMADREEHEIRRVWLPRVKWCQDHHMEDLAEGLKRDLLPQMKKRVIITRQKGDAIKAAIDAVPDERHREVLSLYYLDGLIMEDIAERMAYCHGTVKRLIDGGKALLPDTL
ncbi:sigma factor-like helix-turn-helix DNA-binding protein [Eubacterium aggregans]|uniref:sigma factor-like helix-turn-helix DNA-binding protein n=1 Tax=Eubacterium aggregans TaxID=81409 RepID=UPI003F3CD9A7